LINPNIAGAGIIAVVSAYLFARFIGMDRSFLDSGFYTYNPLLVGLSIGYLFKLTPLTISLVVVSGIFALIFTLILAHLFSVYLKLPILSLPFAILSSVVYLAASRYTNLYVSSLYNAPQTFFANSIPVWVSGFLKSLGAIFFLPHILPGLIFAFVLLLCSRILLLLAVLGYATGTLMTAFMVGSSQQAFSDINHFNYILIAVAVGGVFLIPSTKSFVMAIIAVLTSAIFLQAMDVFWSYYGIPAFTLPFNFISLSFVFVLGLVNYPHVTKVFKATPEETLDWYLANKNRFKGSDRSLVLPFTGRWTVWQAFDGKWTHQGSWRHAYDFIIVDGKGESSRNSGAMLSDYYAFNKPVLSPVRGRVVNVVDDLVDNPIGQVDKHHPWGNLVVIQDERGFFAEISHLAKESITVKEGDWVERGALLGKCGNSGYSPQPHIHVQVQLNEKTGGHTLPFSFAGYRIGDEFFSNNLPPEGSNVEPVILDKELDVRTSFILDNRYSFEILRRGRKIDEMTLTVKTSPDGIFYFDSDRGRLYFGKHERTFYVYQLEGKDPYLTAIFCALPRMPLGFKENLQWDDYLPLQTVVRGWRRRLIQSLSVFYHGIATTRGVFVFREKSFIDGTITSTFSKVSYETEVELDDGVGFKTIRTNDVEIRRIPDEASRS
jgi:urea transporter